MDKAPTWQRRMWLVIFPLKQIVAVEGGGQEEKERTSTE